MLKLVKRLSGDFLIQDSRDSQQLGTYTLVITEKPDAATRIAQALDAKGSPKRLLQSGVPYFEAERNEKIVIVPALGHLYTVGAGRKGGIRYPIFDYKWVPRYQVERGANRIRGWLQVISKLAEDASAFVDACDYDIEGSIIGYSILKYACGNKENEAKRMKYSTLTSEELDNSYKSLMQHLDFALIEAGLSRHEVDWLYGINISRALTEAAKKTSNRYETLSTGRVQGPTLKFLALRERNIQSFVPLPYWTLKLKIEIGKFTIEVLHEKKVFQNKLEMEVISKRCKSKTAEVEQVEKKKFRQMPPFPFDLGSLQTEAYKVFGYSPMSTSRIAQKLYLSALISYPRTSSQKLPPEIGYEKILQSLAANREYTRAAAELLSKQSLKPTEGKKFDPAHPAIYPTGKKPEKTLLPIEKNIYDLVVKRFFAVFGDPALRQNAKVLLNVNGEKFSFGGVQTLEEGWLHLYEPYARLRDNPLPLIEKGDVVSILRVLSEEKFTKPPPRYNPSSLLRKMEKGGIGTKATRAGILQTLYDRKYVRGEKITVTDLGLEVTEVLREYCPSVVSTEFTRQLEEKMDKVQQGQVNKSGIISDAIENLKNVTCALFENEKEIGEKLSYASQEARMEERIIGGCPTCHTGTLIIQYSRKTGKRFVGCTNFFKGSCNTAFPLPQKGFIKPSDKTCKDCGLKTVLVWIKGKRPWNLCFNTQCPSKRSQNKI